MVCRSIYNHSDKHIKGEPFEEVEANRVEARHDVNNPGSGKVMSKCGMKYEGTLRQFDINNTGLGDTAYYGILRDEWIENKKRCD